MVGGGVWSRFVAGARRACEAGASWADHSRVDGGGALRFGSAVASLPHLLQVEIALVTGRHEVGEVDVLDERLDE